MQSPNAVTRFNFSDLVKSTDSASTSNFSFALGSVRTSSGSLVAAAPGTVVIWDNALTAFRPVANNDTIPAQASTLPDGAPVAIVAGTAAGAGIMPSDVTFTTTPQSVTLLYRGAGKTEVYADAFLYDVSVLTATRNLIRTQLERQGVEVSNASATVVHTWV